MSDEPPVNAEVQPLSSINTDDDTIFNQPNGNDWFLATLVQYANIGIEIPVTLSVSGSTISGHLIGGRAFFEELEKSIKGGTATADPGVDPQEFLIGLAETLGEYREIYAVKNDESWAENISKPHFVHLRGARVVATGGVPVPGDGLLWRGKASSVDGVAVGAIVY